MRALILCMDIILEEVRKIAISLEGFRVHYEIILMVY